MNRSNPWLVTCVAVAWLPACTDVQRVPDGSQADGDVVIEQANLEETWYEPAGYWFIPDYANDDWYDDFSGDWYYDDSTSDDSMNGDVGDDWYYDDWEDQWYDDTWGDDWFDDGWDDLG